ncbi:MDR family MFS transporter [Ornithinibacillus sp. 4-3]|uniref:MDR family MFS transporter n=1 Tax=Ornithinibacillus sp. 4-3 TaxID=3231488 RepID=A0AB39HQL5_9BACI
MPKNIWILVTAMVVNTTGASFLWPLITIYMHNHLGKSLAFAGLILMFSNAASIVGNLIGGTLFDKYSAYKTLLYGAGIVLSASTVLIFYNDILPFALCLIFINFGSGITWPIMFALAGSVWPEGGRRSFNALYVGNNLGVALGATFGGLIASISFQYIFIANVLFFIAFLGIVIFTFKVMDQKSDPQMNTNVIEQRSKIEERAPFIALLILCIGFFVVTMTYAQWGSTIAAYTQDIGIPLEQYSILWAINGFLIVVGQPLIKWITNVVKSEKVHLYIGHSIFILSVLVALFAKDFTMFAVAMIIITIGEMLIWPAIPALAYRLAPKGKIGFYQGIVNSVGAAGRMTGPLLGGFIVDYFNIQLLFYILVGILFLPFITTAIFDRGLKKENQVG